MDLAIADKDRAKVVAEQRRTDNLVERLISFQVYHRDVAPRLIGDIETGQSNDLSAPRIRSQQMAARRCYAVSPLSSSRFSIADQLRHNCLSLLRLAPTLLSLAVPPRLEGTPLVSCPIRTMASVGSAWFLWKRFPPCESIGHVHIHDEPRRSPVT
jgi:hypothetical protein